MCGLTGFAAHPKYGGTGFAKLILPDLLLSIENRGREATGIAALGGSDDFIYKVAVKASDVVKSPSFDAALNRINDASMVIGHTRAAYVVGGNRNSKSDSCAHPFQIGGVVGAHNGVIYNWKEIMTKLKPAVDWQVDSQAIFALLDEKKKPGKALEELEGYFALSWEKDGKLFLARSESAQLSAAYVPTIRTLFWHSEYMPLKRVLEGAGIKSHEYEIWTLRDEVIYSYDVEKFTEKGTESARQEVKFKQATGKQHGTSGIPSSVGLRPETGRGRVRSYDSWKDYEKDRDKHHKKDLGRDYDEEWWNRERYDSKALPPAGGSSAGNTTGRSQGQISLLDLQKSIEKMASAVMRAENQIIAGKARIAQLERNIEHLFAILTDAGVIDEGDQRFKDFTAKPRIVTPQDPADDTPEETPYAPGASPAAVGPEARSEAQAQADIFEEAKSAPSKVCSNCGRMENATPGGKLFSCGEGRYIHDYCIGGWSHD